MKLLGKHTISPGEIWAVTGTDSAVRSAWCARVVRDEDLAGEAALLSFAQQAEENGRTGWPQARYYGEEGRTVAEFLSFDAIYEVNPYEVGARYPETRRAYRERLDALMALLDLQTFRHRPVIALSNGETRRVLLARALARRPKLLVLDDPAAGLDTRQQVRLKHVLAALAENGLSIVFACRHADEVPPGATQWLTIGRNGRARTIAAPTAAKPMRQTVASARHLPPSDAQPVVEIKNLNLAVGGRQLFNSFSWTVRKGERWILRGENGSGKTTLFALITGDSPLAYAADIRVFGIPRETGAELAKIRRRIGVASPEMQAYLGFSPDELLARALQARHDLLLLDEPFTNLDARAARRAAHRIEAYLRRHRDATAILVCHRPDEAPRLFDRELNLDARAHPVNRKKVENESLYESTTPWTQKRV